VISRPAGPVGLVLAAGAGRRFGGPKALAELAGTPLVVRAVGELAAAGVRPILVVVGAAADRVAAVLPAISRPVPAPGWAEGMGASLRAGLAAAAELDATAALVTLVDTPDVTEHVHRRILASAARAPGRAVVASYGGKRGHPVLLPAAAFTEVAATARGDRGARDWLAAHPTSVATVDCSDLAAGSDVDTPDELRRWAPGRCPAP
jgi:CTP:molybdopterin cytidylyltransferase MocA